MSAHGLSEIERLLIRIDWDIRERRTRLAMPTSGLKPSDPAYQAFADRLLRYQELLLLQLRFLKSAEHLLALRGDHAKSLPREIRYRERQSARSSWNRATSTR